jgi:hypothetical protein
MFRGDNLLLSCHDCNGLKYKGPRMKWDGERARLLNPSVDDPLCYLQIDLTYQDRVNGGRIEPHSDLSGVARRRAAYTINRLGLDKRALPRSRARIIRQFLSLLRGLLKFGPEHEMGSGYSIRQWLLDMLQPSEPYLASIRQFLHDQPTAPPNC